MQNRKRGLFDWAMLTCCRQEFIWAVFGSWFTRSFPSVCHQKTAAASVFPRGFHPGRPTFIYSCNTITSFYLLRHQREGQRVEESTPYCNTENALARPTSLFVAMTVKWPLLLVFLLDVSTAVCGQTRLCEEAYQWKWVWLLPLLVNKQHLALPVALHWCYPPRCLTHRANVQLFSNKYQTWGCEQPVKSIWHCYSYLSWNQLGCIWPWRGLLGNTVYLLEQFGEFWGMSTWVWSQNYRCHRGECYLSWLDQQVGSERHSNSSAGAYVWPLTLTLCPYS